MRTLYVLTMVSDALTSIPAFKLKTPPEHLQGLASEIKQFLALPDAERIVAISTLSTFDCLLERKDWCHKWKVLLSHRDLPSVLKSAAKIAGLEASALAGLDLFGAKALACRRVVVPPEAQKPPQTGCGNNDGSGDGADPAGSSSNAPAGQEKTEKTDELLSATSVAAGLLDDLRAVPLGAINNFTILGSDSKLLDKSDHAVSLQITSMGSRVQRIILSKLNALSHGLYMHISQNENESILCNLAEDKKTDFCRITYPVPKDLVMPMCGEVSQTKPKSNSTPFEPFLTLFGIPFFMHFKTDPRDCDVVTPAFSVKNVNRHDIAYFHDEIRIIPIIVKKTGLNDWDIDIVIKPPMDAPDAAPQPAAAHMIEVDCRVRCLVPNVDIDDKIEKDLDEQRSKAEKAVKSMVSTWTKSRHIRAIRASQSLLAFD